MRLLSERIRSMTDSQGFSVLYSDIGPDFYDTFGGWKTYDADELVIPRSQNFVQTILARPLDLAQAAEWIDKDVGLIEREFDDEEGTAVQMIPLHGELEWATLRGRQAAEHLNLKVSENVGAVFTSADGWGYMLWFHEYSKSSLTVLRLREPASDSALRGLLEAVVKEADRSQLEKVTIWSPSERLERISGIQKVLRKSSLPGLLYLAGEEKVKWRNIEKLGWC
jgi:hypothetical protein